MMQIPVKRGTCSVPRCDQSILADAEHHPSDDRCLFLNFVRTDDPAGLCVQDGG